MAFLPHATTQPRLADGSYPAPPQPTTVYEVFRRHLQALASLPGEVSEFDQSEFGYEWRCEFEIGVYIHRSPQAEVEHSLQLHFSLVDLDRQPNPAAVLYLVTGEQDRGRQKRLMLPLEDLSETQEQLVAELTRRDTTLDMLNNADQFVAALGELKDLLGSEVVWT